MGFVLGEPPGFVDIPDSLLTADSIASGFAFSSLKDNAAFGSVVPEVFYTTQNDGSTVPLPVSPVDGYAYQRSELIYIWEVENTLVNQAGAPSVASGLLWAEWYVEANTGVCHSLEVYGTNSLNSWQASNNGTLGVWTFGIRGRGLRTLAAIPSYTDLPASDFAEDDAATATILQQLSHNGKLSGVQCEIIPVNPSNAPVWQPSTFYAEGSLVQPTGVQASGFWFIAANSGTSGTIEPTWPGVWHDSAPTDDGSIVWNVAGAGFYNGQQIPYPVSPVDGYQYSSADEVIPFISFISTQSMPIQKQAGTVFTSGNRILRLGKSVVGTQPSNPVQSGAANGLPGIPQVSNPTQTIWNGTLQNWTPVIAPPSAPSLSYASGGTLPAATYYVKATYTSPAGETLASSEASIAVPANNLLVVASPAASGAATGYNVYVSMTSGAEELQGASPTPLGTNWQELTTGLDPGNGVPSSNTTGFVPSPAEANVSPYLTPGSPTTGVGIVSTLVTYINGAYTDGTVMAWCLCFRHITAMAAPGGANFTDMATDWFTSGNPLRSDYMQDVNENAKFSILRPEIFLNANVTPGTAVPIPTSPVDGYVYGREELTYMWYFADTGHDSGALRNFSTYVDPLTGIVNTVNQYYRTNGTGTLATIVYGSGGLITFQNVAATGDGKQSVNVIVVAQRQHETELQTQVIVSGGGQTPAPPGPYNLIPNGDFAIWSIPSTSAVIYFGVADDWGVLQNSGFTSFSQYPGIGNSLFAQRVAARPCGSFTQRRLPNPPGGNNLASIASMIIPVWPGGTYAYSFIASSYGEFGPGAITYGVYARIHLLQANAGGDPDLATDVSFELLGPNLTVPPGLLSSNNPGGAVTLSPPEFDSFQFTFSIPLAGATFAQTSLGQSILSGSMSDNPAYLYVEFLLWDIVSSDNGTDHALAIILDKVYLQDLTEGSTNLNQQGSVPTGGGDNAAFSYSTTTTSIGLWWTAFQLAQSDGTLLSIAAAGSSGSPAESFTGLTASTTYYVSCRYNLSTFALEFMNGTSELTTLQITQWANADGHIPVFGNWEIATPSSGGGGGGGGGGGSKCFTGETKVRTVWGFVPFEQLGKVVMIENETGQHLADVIVHEDAEDYVIPLGTGRVNLIHLIRNGKGKPWVASGKLFKNVMPTPFKGKLYTLKVRSDREEDQHFIIEGGWCAHNGKVY